MTKMRKTYGKTVRKRKTEETVKKRRYNKSRKLIKKSTIRGGKCRTLKECQDEENDRIYEGRLKRQEKLSRLGNTQDEIINSIIYSHIPNSSLHPSNPNSPLHKSNNNQNTNNDNQNNKPKQTKYYETSLFENYLKPKISESSRSSRSNSINSSKSDGSNGSSRSNSRNFQYKH